VPQKTIRQVKELQQSQTSNNRHHGVRNITIITTSKTQQLTASSKEKTHINVVVIGHVDSGKSTTTGRKQSPIRARTAAPMLTRVQT